jgi:hypothetical protein
MLSPFVIPDKHVRKNPDYTYTVRSIYFDTPDLLFYREKMEGVPYRLKLRIRGYNLESETAPVFLEIKRKHKVPMTKNRAPFPFNVVKGILNGSQTHPDQVFFKKESNHEDYIRFVYQLNKGNLAPTVLVVYDREPYEAMDDHSIRITFDKNLRSAALPKISELYRDDLKAVMTEHFILEVKYNKEYPEWMQLIANTFGLKQVAASKYCMSMDNHHGLLEMRPWQLMMARNEAMRKHV